MSTATATQTTLSGENLLPKTEAPVWLAFVNADSHDHLSDDSSSSTSSSSSSLLLNCTDIALVQAATVSGVEDLVESELGCRPLKIIVPNQVAVELSKIQSLRPEFRLEQALKAVHSGHPISIVTKHDAVATELADHSSTIVPRSYLETEVLDLGSLSELADLEQGFLHSDQEYLEIFQRLISCAATSIDGLSVFGVTPSESTIIETAKSVEGFNETFFPLKNNASGEEIGKGLPYLSHFTALSAVPQQLSWFRQVWTDPKSMIFLSPGTTSEIRKHFRKIILFRDSTGDRTVQFRWWSRNFLQELLFRDQTSAATVAHFLLAREKVPLLMVSNRSAANECSQPQLLRACNSLKCTYEFQLTPEKELLIEEIVASNLVDEICDWVTDAYPDHFVNMSWSKVRRFCAYVVSFRHTSRFPSKSHYVELAHLLICYGSYIFNSAPGERSFRLLRNFGSDHKALFRHVHAELAQTSVKIHLLKQWTETERLLRATDRGETLSQDKFWTATGEQFSCQIKDAMDSLFVAGALNELSDIDIQKYVLCALLFGYDFDLDPQYSWSGEKLHSIISEAWERLLPRNVQIDNRRQAA